MKRLAFVLLVLLMQNPVVGQNDPDRYPFKTTITGSGKPIILIPGLASAGEVWQQTVASLQESYQCHVLTLAGFAGEPPIDLTAGFLPVVKSGIETYIKNELTAKPILIGHSLGGFLAMDIAATAPELISAIVIVDSYPFMAAAYNPNATAASTLPRAKMMHEMILSATDSAFAQQQKLTLQTMIADADKVELATHWSIESDRATIAQAMVELMTTDLREEIDSIRVPTLVLGSWYGAKDYGITKTMIETTYSNQFSKVKNCKIKIANSAKHFIMWDDFDWFYAEVDTFMSNGQ